MTPPALVITVTMFRPGAGWSYTVRKLGEPIACSDGEAFDGPGMALKAAIDEIKSQMAARNTDDPGSASDAEGDQ